VRRNLEQYLGKKAQDMLEKVLGPGQAIVRVSADINFDTVTRTEEKYDPDGQVVRTQTKNDENNDASTSSTTTSPAGISANTVTETNSFQSAASPLSNTKNRKTTSTVEYDIGKVTIGTLQSAGGVKRLSAAVTVAAHFDGAGADRKMVTRAPEELEKLRRMVQNAIGSDNTRGDQVTLDELPFNDQFALDVTRELQLQQKNQFWWGLIRGAVYPVLGLAALVMLIVIFKRTPVQDIPIGVPVGRLVQPRSNGNAEWSRDMQAGIVTVDVLNRLVKENPANMTQAIRDWMNKGQASEP
jgi:flagellar M-ring protein FliF